MIRLFLVALFVIAMPLQAGERHMGVATCASSVCHGSSADRAEANILHSEYVIWGQRDPHAGAYRTLLGNESRRMAEKLNIGPAHQAPVCLACHSDFVPEKERGERFQLSDGVGCESCHGGAEHWLSSHTESGVTHADNIQRGLRPLQQAEQRAALCAGCHVADEERFASHDLMGAGHPRLQFELATYSRLWPSHHRDDPRYRARKKSPDSMELWLAGQLKTATRMLEDLKSDRFMATPLWPELAFFDCHACHTPMDADKWQPRPAAALAPGAVRLNDSALLMIGWLLDASDGAAALRWRDQVAALHQASQLGREAVAQAADVLLKQLMEIESRFARQGFDSAQQQNLLGLLVRQTGEAVFNDYMTSEQVLMALALVHEQQGGDPAALNGLYNSMADQHRFRSAEFVRSMTLFGQQYEKSGAGRP